MSHLDAVASYSSIYDQTYMYALSVDEVVDCCLPNPIEDPHVFDCVHDHDGLCPDDSYHSGSDPNVCNNASCKAVASVGSFANVDRWYGGGGGGIRLTFR